MRLGASPYGSDRAATLAFADALVDAGLDTLWLGDGMFHRPDFPGWRGGMESLTELAWLAGRPPGRGSASRPRCCRCGTWSGWPARRPRSTT
ncbi:MAG TPA: hypothetical protein VFI47_04090 [Acidimicrobiales bacterium]|nr:hypothetical protein [Acidimicrobiales bacterium]